MNYKSVYLASRSSKLEKNMNVDFDLVGLKSVTELYDNMFIN